MKIDLHLHTLYSDGFISPKTLLQKSSKKGLQVVSIVDHDSVFAYEYLEEKKYDESNISLIPGIELSVLDSETNLEFHILGYGINYKNPKLKKYLSYVREREDRRLEVLLEVAKSMGLPDFSKLFQERHACGYGNGKMVFFRILEIKGVNKEKISQFKLVVNQRLENLERIQLDPKDAIQLIKQCGGLSALAHAGEYNLEKNALIETILKFKNFGLDAVEVYHSSHSKDYSEELLNIAKQENLLISGGSDAHFYKSYGTEKRQLGTGTKNNLDIDSVSVVDILTMQNKVINFCCGEKSF